MPAVLAVALVASTDPWRYRPSFVEVPSPA